MLFRPSYFHPHSPAAPLCSAPPLLSRTLSHPVCLSRLPLSWSPQYQSAQLMAAKGVNVPFGIPAKSVAEAVAAGEKIGDDEVVIKSQILAGGRVPAPSRTASRAACTIKTSQIKEYADKMLGQTLVTKQSGAAGKPVDTLLIAKKMNLVAEKYFAILLDRATMGPLIIACSEGGTSIEDLAEKFPDKIIKVPVDINTGITDAQALEVAKGFRSLATSTPRPAKSRRSTRSSPRAIAQWWR